MVAEGAGRPARPAFSLSGTGPVWNTGQNRVEGVSYAPVTFMSGPEGPRVVVGGLGMLDSSFTSTRTGMQLLSIYSLCFLGGTLLLGLSLWWLAHSTGKNLNRLSGELREPQRAQQSWRALQSSPSRQLELERSNGM